MNIVRIKKFIHESNKLLVSPLSNLEKSPLLTFEYKSYSLSNYMGGDEMKPGGPFPLFQYAFKVDGGILCGGIQYDSDAIRAVMCGRYKKTEYVFEVGENSESGVGTVKAYRPFSKNLTGSVAADVKEELLEIYSAIYYLYVLSGMPLAKVTKSCPGKSVDFYQKHEYWTTVPRVHPANSSEVKNGSDIKLTDEQIKRCAHHRRAHYRILRSERYKNARNKKIFVKSCWVGPEEWREGNQIYRIQTMPSD